VRPRAGGGHEGGQRTATIRSVRSPHERSDMRGRRGCLAPCRPGEVVIVDGARYATNFLYNQRRPSWRRQTWPRTSRPVMLRLGMMTRRRCQVVGLARFNPNLRMLIVVIDAMLPHLTQAARRRPRPQRASRPPHRLSRSSPLLRPREITLTRGIPFSIPATGES
jgi:hypothetical protein